MEKHTCNLCFRSFANGRALGGHMRSHVAASNKSAAAAAETTPAQIHKVYFSSPSASFSSTSEDDDKGYGLRENPKKSYRLADPDFSSPSAAADAAGSCALVQDRESESESSRAPAHRRRSKRARPAATPPTPDPEPVSSVSDASPEEDVAISLMMLSRDTWKNYNESEERDDYDDDQEVEVEEEKEEVEEELTTKKKLGKSKYQCKTCKKAFRSYQALGGHRASHKKFKSCVPPSNSSPPVPAAARIYDIELAEANAPDKVVHECPICFRIFASGQALGGHKRSHLTPSAAATITITPPPPAASVPVPVSKFGDTMIDLNLPAPMEDDADRLSAVSDELNWVTKR